MLMTHFVSNGDGDFSSLKLFIYCIIPISSSTRSVFLLSPPANAVEAVEVLWLSGNNPGGSNQKKHNGRSQHAHCIGSIKWITRNASF